MTSIVISSGHSTKVRGAAGPSPWGLDEVNEATRVVNKVGELLKQMGVGVTTYHDTVSTSQSENLDRLVDFHNSKTRDLDVSVHFNAYNVTTTKKMGVEVLYVTQQSLAAKVSAAIAKTMALPDRGAKKRTDLAFLNGTEEPAILIETCFVDAKMDADAYRANFDAVCAAIAESISGQSIGEQPPEPEEETTLPPAFDQATIDEIRDIAASSPIADYSWKDRGQAPGGYIQGMALAYGMAVRRFLANDSYAIEAAKAESGNADVDALSWYGASAFQAVGMSISTDGLPTLRALYSLMLGLGMRESSGKHCEGVDQSASNHEADTAEASLFQTSWNINTCSPEVGKLFEQYGGCLDDELSQCYLDVFEDGVSCNSASWKCWGSTSSDGYKYQEMSKKCPPFHTEVTAIGLRKRRQHWGPIARREAELRTDADVMFKAIEDIVMELDGGGPVAEVVPTITITVDPPGSAHVKVIGAAGTSS